MQKVYLGVHGEFDEVRVVCRTQNRLQMRGMYLNVFGENAERI
jgi:hypothetical protein